MEDHNSKKKSLVPYSYVAVAVAVVLALFADYRLFVEKSARLSTYDDISSRLNSARVSITRLEYLMDMFVVSRTFEPSTIDIIKGDIDSLDRDIDTLMSDRRYGRLMKANPFMSEGLSGVKEEWDEIESQIKTLSGSLGQDELMLIHNDFDTHTILVTERIERLIAAAAEARSAVAGEQKALAFKNLMGLLVFLIAMAYAYWRVVVRPLNRMASTAKSLAHGEEMARFEGGSRLFSRLAEGLNQAVSYLIEARSRYAMNERAFRQALSAKDVQIEALSAVASLQTKPLPMADMLSSSLKKAKDAGKASCIAFFATGDDCMRLKAWDGLEPAFARQSLTVPLASLGGHERKDAPAVYTDLLDFPNQSIAEGMRSQGVRALLTVPVVYDSRDMGVLLVAFKDDGVETEGLVPFYTAFSTALAVYMSHRELFQNEYGARSFLERILNQMPLGIAVFDRKGVCQVFNTCLKKLIGADRRFVLVNLYNIFEDEVLSCRDIQASIKKTYEGYATEFVIDYNPQAAARHYFSGPPKRLKIRTYPVYDVDGSISSIMLVYEAVEAITEPSREGGGATR